MRIRKVAAVLGTRPEAIKLALVIRELRRRSAEFETVVISSGQHRSMLDQALELFRIRPDVDLDVMRANQTLGSLTERVLDTVDNALSRFQPDILLVQGDTTTAFASALAAFYRKIPVGHVEAGLRSHDLWNPFPEEGNRKLVSMLAEIHFAPTALARQKLLAESIPADNIVVTGNTVVDALQALTDVETSWVDPALSRIPTANRRIILVTSHRRESWGAEQQSMCEALKQLVAEFDDLEIVYPVHLNPNVRSTVSGLLEGVNRIHLIEPLNYMAFVSLLRRCHLVLTDSGGVQEEAPTFGKPVLVLRKVTERPEASQFGLAKIVGMDTATIVRETGVLLREPQTYGMMSLAQNPYGDGRASHRIVEAISHWSSGIRPLLPAEQEFSLVDADTPLRRRTDHLQAPVRGPDRRRGEAAPEAGPRE